MGGRYSRDKGHRYERNCANRLSGRTGLEVLTTRKLGASYGADLATVTGYDGNGRPAVHVPSVLGWSVECKDVEAWAPEAWVDQAVNQAAPDTRPVVLANRSGCPFGKGWALFPDPTYGWVATSIDNWMETL